jgi:hypothetical protein
MEKLIEQISKLLPVKEINSTDYTLLYVDFDYEDNKIPEVFQKYGVLKYSFDNYTYNDILKIIKINFDNLTIDKQSKFKNLTKLDDVDKFINRLKNISNYIAADGRIGKANTIILNEKWYNIIKNNDYFKELDFIVDELLDDKIYLYRKNNIDYPGIIFVYNKQEKSFNIVNLGYYPEKQVEVVYF